MTISLNIVSKNAEEMLVLDANQLVIAGWAGRDKAAMEHHIAELEALGVPRPAETPTFYRVAASRLTIDPSIQVSGDTSSGEVEPVIVASGGKLFVGIGSDHTDRELEAHGVTLSKQICEKPISSTLWPIEEVIEHWDQLIMRSYIEEDGGSVLYQEGTLDGLLHPHDTMSRLNGDASLEDGTVLLCGTVPALGGIRSAPRFVAELEDPVLSRKISLRYDIDVLPIAG
ncbi:DUF2848 domain-containing protein [Rhodobacteraceae bacterium D3-12]|nr:DUF2848 domain-containing protein [Rhodobacteraceae bacterium D3-12]